ncbi:methionine adenosyltransferase [Finegoldia magna]|uniref:S-adenosylmethionine synthase n=2 Tax=Finegoldia magna TaxID=1260 RepID=METK_FINM2|nr:methionine adenosyltransferase [Finegoldia magna]B0S2I6.1 RecName: Full=S-adenosylmethionine synthase; Short=AdoMet synthase; AltName: Full=MAT; AltName: Full=Methionine adenosyltransferase [Finegoldia magna ATCC 29328]EFL54121.1 methionine adenosyltransferase [Finegoldia magna BVS033A4]UEA70078.1 methionine adenosyltransferase [Finegoldia magna]BAG08576.1 S-adenosylmethionine synthetase [Finegoldia magna ATCC 29328]
MKNIFLTSESVTEGHPDKVCDQISDAILDAIIKEDKDARVACETCSTTGLVMVMGEITTTSYVDIRSIVRKTLAEIGYDNADYGIDARTCAIITSLEEQSKDIAQGVDESEEYKDNKSDEYDRYGAGDQGMVFGYATNETESGLPLPLELSHKLARRLATVRKEKILNYLRPDGKTQVTVEYENDAPKRIEAIVVSTQHDPDVDYEQLKEDIKREVILKIVDESMIDENTKFFINPTGKFVIGGPMGDAGLTGRKIIVDTYGGFCNHGGGAFSGKDPTKTDRSAAYFARYIAKNVVAAGLCDKCEVGFSYAIGVAKPISMFINTFGTNKIEEEKIIQAINENFDARPKAIIDKLDLQRPIYREVASYGHFGRNDLDLSWEKCDKAEALKKYL